MPNIISINYDDFVNRLRELIDDPRLLFDNNLDKVREFAEMCDEVENVQRVINKCINVEWFEACSVLKNRIDAIEQNITNSSNISNNT